MARLPGHPAPHLTRRGSLAYYLAAWVCGSFFFAAARLYNYRPSAFFSLPLNDKTLFAFYFLTLTLGSLSVFLFAFLLRTLARACRWARAWQWALLGAMLTFALSAITTLVPSHPGDSPNWYLFSKELFELGGRDGVSLQRGSEFGMLLTILAGMVTAYILFRIEHAFRSREEAPQG